MPRLTKIYTRKGDQGETALGTKQRVPKDHVRVNAYGVVDELNTMIGVAISQGLSDRLMQTLPNIQNELFNLGSDLAFPAEDKEEFEVPRIHQHNIYALEIMIDELNEVVGPLENFILPGGSHGAAFLQLARTVCRRAERAVVTLAQQEDPGELTLAYLNRLSDALFVMGRYENKKQGIDEPLWDSHA